MKIWKFITDLIQLIGSTCPKFDVGPNRRIHKEKRKRNAYTSRKP